jgi:ribosomal protein S18 acetylase RimI-like enzyme
MKIDTRKIEPGEINRLVPLWRAMMDYHQDMHPIFAYRHDDEVEIEKAIREYADRPACHIYGAFVESELAGYILLQLVNRPSIFTLQTKVVIDGLYVSPEYRSAGIGSRLSSLIPLHFPQADFIELNVVNQNKPGTSFWKAQGFEELQLNMVKLLQEGQ